MVPTIQISKKPNGTVGPNNFSQDCIEFIELLNKYQVKYVMVGGESVIYHGYARLTGDVDFFYDLIFDNCEKLFNALLEFWDGDIPGINKPDDLKPEGYFIQFGTPPNRIDLMNSIDGISFSEVWSNKINELIFNSEKEIPVNFIGLEELQKNKKASSRPKDLQDFEYLKS